MLGWGIIVIAVLIQIMACFAKELIDYDKSQCIDEEEVVEVVLLVGSGRLQIGSVNCQGV